MRALADQRSPTLSSGRGVPPPSRCSGSLPGTGTASTESPLGAGRRAVSGSSTPSSSGRQRHLPGEALAACGRATLPSVKPRRTALGGVDDQRLRLAQRQQAQAVVEVAVGQQDAGDGRVARRARPQRREALDLRADLGRGIEQEPASPSALTATDSWRPRAAPRRPARARPGSSRSRSSTAESPRPPPSPGRESARSPPETRQPFRQPLSQREGLRPTRDESGVRSGRPAPRRNHPDTS